MKSLLAFLLFAIVVLLSAPANAQTWVQVSAGGYHNIGLKSDGTIWSWGDNSDGELGDGTTDQKNGPVQIGTDNDWVGIAAGSFHSLGLKSNGTLWAWGYNSYGELGDGTNTDQAVPIQIGSENNWSKIAAGNNHSLALKSDGTLWAWGYNFYGQLGDGSDTDRNSPVQIGTDNNWICIAAGALHSFGLKSDSTLFAWGYNDYGQLGDGTITWQYSPVTVVTDNSKWVAVTAGQYHSLGLKADSSVWAWGNNANGKLGDGTFNNQINPERIGTDHTWTGIAAGYDHSLALKKNGTLWTWGFNGQGQLGDGTNTTRTSPVQAGPDNSWVTATAGFFHTIGLKSDHSQFCASGSNIFGQLGDNTTIGKNTFICNSNTSCTSAPVVGNIVGSTTACGITGTSTSNSYTVGNIPEATSYLWSKSISLMQIVSGQYSSSINVTFSSTFTTGTLTLTVTNGCGTTVRTITITKKVPSTPGAIAGNTNPCAYTGTGSGNATSYSVTQADGATSYIWTVPAGVTIAGGTSPFTTSDTSISISFPAAFTTGVIKVQSNNSCGTSSARSLTVTTRLPATPGTITGPVEVCALTGNNVDVTYTIRKVAFADSYEWQLPSGVTVTSPNINDTAIGLNFPAGYTTGMIKVRSLSACGNSAFRSLTVTAKLPVIPGAIIGPVDVCFNIGNNIDVEYSIGKVPNAASYEWQIPAGVTVVSSNINDTNIIVNFPAGYTTGAIKVRSVSPCGTSAFRSLTVAKKLSPIPGIIAANGSICTSMYTGTTTVTYTIPSPATAPLPDSYIWTLVPTVSGSAVIVNGTSTTTIFETTSLSIDIQFYGNYTGGTLSVKAKRACGASNPRTLILTKNIPPTPSVPTASGNICNSVASSVTYTVASNPNTDLYIWRSPAGTKIAGSHINAPTMDTTSTNSIVVNYPAGFTSGNLTVKAKSVCGLSAVATLSVASAGCLLANKVISGLDELITFQEPVASVYPNPNNGNFNVKINSADKTDPAVIQIMDMLGQVVASYTRSNNKGLILLQVSNDKLRNGMYILKYTIGTEVRSLKFIVQN